MEQNATQVNDATTINVDVRVKKRDIHGKDYVWNPAPCNCDNRKYLGTIMVIRRLSVMKL